MPLTASTFAGFPAIELSSPHPAFFGYPGAFCVPGAVGKFQIARWGPGFPLWREISACFLRPVKPGVAATAPAMGIRQSGALGRK